MVSPWLRAVCASAERIRRPLGNDHYQSDPAALNIRRASVERPSDSFWPVQVADGRADRSLQLNGPIAEKTTGVSPITGNLWVNKLNILCRAAVGSR